MGSFSDYLENKVLDHVFGGSDYTRPANLYVGLSTTPPTEAGGNITEPSGGAYARKQLTNNPTNFPAANSGTKTNGTHINFATATASWGTITHCFIADAISGGNILGSCALSSSRVVNTGDTVSMAAGDLTITLN